MDRNYKNILHSSVFSNNVLDLGYSAMNRPHLEAMSHIQEPAQAVHSKSVKSIDVTVVEIREQERADRNSSLCYVGTKEDRQHGSSDKMPRGLDPRPTMSGYKWPLVVASIMLAMFLFALDNTIAADIAPVIAQDFGAIAKLPWVAVSFCLGAVCTGLLWYSKAFSGYMNGC